MKGKYKEVLFWALIGGICISIGLYKIDEKVGLNNFYEFVYFLALLATPSCCAWLSFSEDENAKEGSVWYRVIWLGILSVLTATIGLGLYTTGGGVGFNDFCEVAFIILLSTFLFCSAGFWFMEDKKKEDRK